MITLPTKFAAENAKAEKIPAVIVRLLEQELSDEQTSQADWQANSAASNVDYTSSPGDVILASAAVPNEEQITANSWGVVHNKSNFGVVTEDNQNWQSFRQNTGGPKTLSTIQVVLKQSGSGTVNIYCEIWDAGKSAQIGSTQSKTGYALNTTGEWLTFDFSVDGTILSENTEYWIKVYASYASGFGVISQEYQNSDVYVNGQFDRTGSSPGTNLGDLKFRVTMTGSYYVSAGNLMTQTMDVGGVPTSPGEWVFNDLQPSGTSISYEAWASDTGAFAGEETYLGTVVDGDAITALKRYFRVRMSLSTTNNSNTPIVQSLDASFAIYRSYADTPVFGHEPAVMGISSLTTTIDTFDPSTISQITVTLAFTQSVSDYLATKFPKNKIVQVLVGFVAAGFTETDFVNYLSGQIDDWAISSKDKVTLTVKDYKKEWDVDVPASWNSTLDDVTWTSQHPVDVMLDILSNHINVRDSKLDLASFSTLKSTLSGWQVTRTITSEPENAADLLEELRLLMSAYFIPRSDGRISIKRWIPSEAPVDSLDDDNTIDLKWSANAGSLINSIYVYTNWDGAGDDAADFSDLRVGVDSTSQNNWAETADKTIKDKWTRTGQASQVDDMITQIITRYADPPSVIELRTDASKIALEVGDIVSVTTVRAPSTDMSGILNKNYQIINRNLDFQKNRIKFKLLEV